MNQTEKRKQLNEKRNLENEKRKQEIRMAVEGLRDYIYGDEGKNSTTTNFKEFDKVPVFQKKIKQKSVVQQLVEKIEHFSNYTIRIPIDVVEQFKEMEKEQIVATYIEASPRLEDIIKEAAEQYYNETFNTNEK
jgi:hypothetical protein